MNYRSCVSRTVSVTWFPCLAIILVLLLATASRAEAVVDLAYFEVAGKEDHVLVEWGTGNELTTFGFNLYRAERDDFSQAGQLNEQMIKAKSFPNANGADYSYQDTDVEPAVTYWYWLKVLDLDGNRRYGPASATLDSPTPTSTVPPTATATHTASPTPTSTPTSLPTATPTSTTGATITSTPTSTPTSVPSATPRPAMTGSWTPPSATQASGEPGAAFTYGTSEGTATPTSTSLIAAALPSSAEIPASIGQSEAAAGPAPALAWPTLSTTTILLFVSVTSFLGVALLAISLPLIRRLGH